MPKFVLPQPVTHNEGWITLLQPRAFFWFRGRLYVGYGWLSSLHMDEEPVWDPAPVEVDTRIETCNGHIDFVEVKQEGPPYYRKYAVLKLVYRYKPDDTGLGNPVIRKSHTQGCVEIEEQHVLFPDCYMQLSWSNGNSGSSLIHPYDIKEYQKFQKKSDRWHKQNPNWFDGGAAPFPQRKHKEFHTPSICLCHKWSGNGVNRFRRIKRAKSLENWRNHPDATRIREQEHPNGCINCH
jgi:hypothetical protein